MVTDDLRLDDENENEDISGATGGLVCFEVISVVVFVEASMSDTLSEL